MTSRDKLWNSKLGREFRDATRPVLLKRLEAMRKKRERAWRRAWDSQQKLAEYQNGNIIARIAQELVLTIVLGGALGKLLSGLILARYVRVGEIASSGLRLRAELLGGFLANYYIAGLHQASDAMIPGRNRPRNSWDTSLKPAELLTYCRDTLIDTIAGGNTGMGRAASQLTKSAAKKYLGRAGKGGATYLKALVTDISNHVDREVAHMDAVSLHMFEAQFKSVKADRLNWGYRAYLGAKGRAEYERDANRFIRDVQALRRAEATLGYIKYYLSALQLDRGPNFATKAPRINFAKIRKVRILASPPRLRAHRPWHSVRIVPSPRRQIVRYRGMHRVVIQ